MKEELELLRKNHKQIDENFLKVIQERPVVVMEEGTNLKNLTDNDFDRP